MNSSPTGPRTPAYQVSPNAIGLWTLQGVISSIFVLAAAVVAALVVPEQMPAPLRFLAAAAPYAAGVYAVVAVAIRPRLRYRVHRWEVTEESVFTLTGWLAQTWTIIPIARIQTVDINRGAMQRLFGLASVAVLTASSKGTVEIVHLDAGLAGAVAPDLASRAAAVRDEAT
ncbi:MAG: PH domain-containing protein [Geodermatophilaceae bacterium]|nr:PH domain-containing protein [Geodermatophilaceae bacterium]MDQ3465481.1 PH domain-containing protein [Actinomycetota bacterium]